MLDAELLALAACFWISTPRRTRAAMRRLRRACRFASAFTRWSQFSNPMMYALHLCR